MTSVIKKDWRIVANKVLFFTALFVITIAITWLSVGDVPEPLAIWTPVILSVLYTIYTGLKSYDEEREGKFKWWWQSIGSGLMTVILKLLKKNDTTQPLEPPPT